MYKRIVLFIAVGLFTMALVVDSWTRVPPVVDEIITFAVLADPHIAVPAPGYTLESCPYIDSDRGRNMCRESVELFTAAIEMVNAIPELDFVVMLGDLTKHSERYNHHELLKLLPQFVVPVYVIIGNHDRVHPPDLVEVLNPDAEIVNADELPTLYEAYWGPGGKTYYSVEPAPGIQLIALDSTRYQNHSGEIDETQLAWLRKELKAAKQHGRVPIVMLHHCVAVHVPGIVKGQPLYALLPDTMIDNTEEVKSVLKEFSVPFALSGHLHVQDIAEEDGIYYIATGSIITYPHPLRILKLNPKAGTLEVTTQIIESTPSQPQWQPYSKEEHSVWFEELVFKYLQLFGVPENFAMAVTEHVRGALGTLSAGDAQLQYEFSNIFPEQTTGIPDLDAGLKLFLDLLNECSSTPPLDNNVTLQLKTAVGVGQ